MGNRNSNSGEKTEHQLSGDTSTDSCIRDVPIDDDLCSTDMPANMQLLSPFIKNGYGTEDKPIKFSEIEDMLSTGDLAVLYRGENKIPHFAVFIKHSSCNSSNFPLLLLKGKTKPLPFEKFNPYVSRDAHTVSATTRIFYGDYRKAAVHQLNTTKKFDCQEIMEMIKDLATISFSEQEIVAVEEASTPEERSAILCTFMVAHFYKNIGELEEHPHTVTPKDLICKLPLCEPAYIKLPKVKKGPIASGDPPFLTKIVNGIMPPPEITPVSFGSLANQLQTGDLVLFSGATSSGALIKLFDHSQFSHVGLVLKFEYVSKLLLWEASTNKAGLVDISSGKVRRGVELLPLTRKIFSGWYDRVAIRRLTGIDSEKRAQMYEELLAFRKEVQGRPYEQDTIELILSSIDVQDKYMSFLRNTEEDLSSLFCSELVAEAYKRMGLLGSDKLSNTYTPDDFTSENDLKLNFGTLEPETYIELKFDFKIGFERQSSVW